MVVLFVPERVGEARFRDLASWCEVHLSSEEQGRLAALLLSFSGYSEVALWAMRQALPEATGSRKERRVRLPPEGADRPADMGDWWGR